MAIWDRFRRPRHTDGIISLAEQIRAEELPKAAPVIVGAGKQDDERKYIEAFDSGRITYSGEIGNLDNLEILQNKQENIQRLFQLAQNGFLPARMKRLLSCIWTISRRSGFAKKWSASLSITRNITIHSVI